MTQNVSTSILSQDSAGLTRNREHRTSDPPPRGMGIIGSRTCPVSPDVISKVLSIIGTIGPTGVLNVRGPDTTHRTSPVEELVWQLGTDAGIVVESWSPLNQNNLHRDRSLVSASPEGLVAFFPVDEVMEGGTGNVTRIALDSGIPVEVYGVDAQGGVQLIGSLDGYQTDPIILSSIDQ